MKRQCGRLDFYYVTIYVKYLNIIRFILKCIVNDQRVSVPENGSSWKKRCMNGNSLSNFEYSANKRSSQLCGVYMKIELTINPQLKWIV